MITIWQRAALQVNDYHSAPSEWFPQLYDKGYKVVHVHLQDGGRVDKEYVLRLKAIGFKVFGTIWPTRDNPAQWAEFCHTEKLRLGLQGMNCNAEDEIEAVDQEQNNYWSKQYLTKFRELMPTLPLCLNTYNGCGGIALPLWEQHGCRLLVQTFHNEELFCWNVPSVKDWARLYGWVNSAKVKPIFAVYKRPDGTRNDAQACIDSSNNASKTKGFLAYYIEGSFDDLTVPNKLAQGGISL